MNFRSHFRGLTKRSPYDTPASQWMGDGEGPFAYGLGGAIPMYFFGGLLEKARSEAEKLWERNTRSLFGRSGLISNAGLSLEQGISSTIKQEQESGKWNSKTHDKSLLGGLVKSIIHADASFIPDGISKTANNLYINDPGGSDAGWDLNRGYQGTVDRMNTWQEPWRGHQWSRAVKGTGDHWGKTLNNLGMNKPDGTGDKFDFNRGFGGTFGKLASADIEHGVRSTVGQFYDDSVGRLHGGRRAFVNASLTLAEKIKEKVLRPTDEAFGVSHNLGQLVWTAETIGRGMMGDLGLDDDPSSDDVSRRHFFNDVVTYSNFLAMMAIKSALPVTWGDWAVMGMMGAGSKRDDQLAEHGNDRVYNPLGRLGRAQLDFGSNFLSNPNNAIGEVWRPFGKALSSSLSKFYPHARGEGDDGQGFSLAGWFEEAIKGTAGIGYGAIRGLGRSAEREWKRFTGDPVGSLVGGVINFYNTASEIARGDFHWGDMMGGAMAGRMEMHYNEHIGSAQRLPEAHIKQLRMMGMTDRDARDIRINTGYAPWANFLGHQGTSVATDNLITIPETGSRKLKTWGDTFQ